MRADELKRSPGLEATHDHWVVLSDAAIPIDPKAEPSWAIFANCLGVHFDKHGSASAFEPGAEISLPTTSIWRIQRATRASPKHRFAGRLQTLEDTPFYARSLLTIEQQGQAQTAVHESLSMTRFKHNWVRLLLPFKMPRRGGTQPPLHSREA